MDLYTAPRRRFQISTWMCANCVSTLLRGAISAFLESTHTHLSRSGSCLKHGGEGEARLDVFDVVHLGGSPPHMSRLNEEQRGRPIGRLQAPPTG